jgi:hypothetical protein
VKSRQLPAGVPLHPIVSAVVADLDGVLDHDVCAGLERCSVKLAEIFVV